ncbi:MAG: hypothetical protein ACYDCL_01005 [Myxococcales bacterium]
MPRQEAGLARPRSPDDKSGGPPSVIELGDGRPVAATAPEEAAGPAPDADEPLPGEGPSLDVGT